MVGPISIENTENVRATLATVVDYLKRTLKKDKIKLLGRNFVLLLFLSTFSTGNCKDKSIFSNIVLCELICERQPPK